MFYFNLATTDNFRRYNSSETAHFILSNDSPLNDLEFSIDGTAVVGMLLPEEQIEIRDANVNELHVRSRVAGAACPFRLWYFGKRNVVYPEAQQAQAERSVKVQKTFKVVPRNDLYK